MNTTGFIKGKETVAPSIETYYALKPQRFGVWDTLNLKRPLKTDKWGDIEIAIRLVSSLEIDPKEPTSMQCLILEFTGVMDLRFGAIDMLGGFFLSIESIKESQWEGLNYRVLDREQEERISFYCRDFTAKLADR